MFISEVGGDVVRVLESLIYFNLDGKGQILFLSACDGFLEFNLGSKDIEEVHVARWK